MGVVERAPALVGAETGFKCRHCPAALRHLLLDHRASTASAPHEVAVGTNETDVSNARAAKSGAHGPCLTADWRDTVFSYH